MSTAIAPEILSIGDVFKKETLHLPDYQRPYKWQTHHTQQLLSDLFEHFNNNKQQYRLGTLVLHKNEKTLDIVDGQQRLTTLSLILHNLGQDTDYFSTQEFNHSISQYNIWLNNQLVQAFFVDKTLIKEEFKTYILEMCELVCVTLSELDEAFQFFDSQNARGKSLEPYDLLKAYHLREIPLDNPHILKYVENWENAVNEDPTLNVIISQVLYRLRQWTTSHNAEEFTANELSVFKGVSEDAKYPYLQGIKAGMALYQAKQFNSFLYAHDFATLPFQAIQTIINGRLFFEYVEHYRKLYHCLFGEHTGHLTRIQLGGKSILDNLDYPGCHRTGDKYVRGLFECAVLMYYDKFGEDGLEIAVNRALHWAYQIRLAFERVYWGRIEQAVADRNGLLHHIMMSDTPSNVAKYFIPKVKVEKDIKELKELLGYKEDDSNVK